MSLAALLFVLAASSPHPGHPAAQIAAAERAFAAQSVAEGMNTAFAAHLADDAVVFKPLPRPGARAWHAAQENPPVTLDWYSAFTLAAASGDFGLSTGPFTLVSQTDPQRRGYGHFISIWERQADGAWKVRIDGGISHPAPDVAIVALDPAAMPANQLSQFREAASMDELAAAEAALREKAMADGVADAIDVMGAAQMRLYLEARLPVIGREAAVETLVSVSPAWTWTMAGGGLARSGDLAYTYGSLHPTEDPEGAPIGSFLHVWQWEGDGWKLLVQRDAVFR